MRLPLRARRVLQRVFCDFTEPLAPFLFSRVYFFPFSGGVLPLSALTGRRLCFISAVIPDAEKQHSRTCNKHGSTCNGKYGA